MYVPAIGSNFQIRIDAPFGEELLKAVVSKRPLVDVEINNFTRRNATPVDEKTVKQFAKSLSKTKSGQADWAEHQVRIQTVEARPVSTSAGPGKRLAVGIGISNYKDQGINDLGICHIDSERMMRLFTDRFGVKSDDSIALANEKATLDNIRKVIKDTLPQMTSPGDVVFIFWSGHGGQTKDQKQEFLIPYDGSSDNVDGSMLYDEAFGRWIQELDGRKVLVILDACHSGGQAASPKLVRKPVSLSKALDPAEDDVQDWKPLRLAFTQLAVAKDIGQKDAAVIASSTSAEVSYVRKERDLSVLTYFLLRAAENSSGALTHTQWCETVKPQVANYVNENFPGKQQTVVMQDDMSEPLVLCQ